MQLTAEAGKTKGKKQGLSRLKTGVKAKPAAAAEEEEKKGDGDSALVA